MWGDKINGEREGGGLMGPMSGTRFMLRKAQKEDEEDEEEEEIEDVWESVSAFTREDSYTRRHLCSS